MKALFWMKGNKLELKDVDEPTIKLPTQVKVKIYGTGICGTDLNLLKGKVTATYGKIIGHEAVGTVVQIGEQVKNISVGDRVIIDPTQFCGKCFYCRKGLTCFCETFDDYQLGIGTDGTFADYYVGDERFMYKIHNSMDWDTAVLVEPLTCVMNVFQKAGVKPYESVLIIGAGPVGLICQMVSKRLARLTVGVELNSFRRQKAKEIADYVYHPAELTLEEVYRINCNRKFDVIIDAVGNQLDKAVKFVEKGGRILPMGFDETYRFTFNPMSFLSKGISIIGAGEVHQMTESALQYAGSIPDLGRLVTSKLPMKNYEEAFNELLGYNCETEMHFESRTIKTVLLSGSNS